MTDNTKFKEEGKALLDMLISFQRKYHMGNKKNAATSHARQFESELRCMLMVARTDEENAHQDKIDSYC